MPKPWEKYSGAGPWEKYGAAAVAPEAQRSYTLGEVPVEAVKNLPKDILRAGTQAAQGVKQMVTHPLETAGAMAELPVGAINLATPEAAQPLPYRGPMMEGLLPGGEPTMGEEAARAAIKEQVDAYGGIENLKRTIAERPTKPLLDLLTVATAGGASVSKAPGLLGAIGRKVSAPGKYIADIPSKMAKGPARWMYGTALDFPEEVGFAGRRASVDLGLKERLGMSEKGHLALQEKLKPQVAARQKIFEELKGEKIPMKEVVEQPLYDLTRDPHTRMGATETGRAVEREIMSKEAALEDLGRDFYTPEELNTLKQNAAAGVPYKYQPTGAPKEAANVAINRAIADAARKKLGELDPRIPEINAQLKSGMDLAGPLYSTAFKGRATASHPILMSQVSRTALPGTGLAGPLGMSISPRVMAKGGILAADVAKGLGKAPVKYAPMAGYVTEELRADKKKQKRMMDYLYGGK